MTPLVYLAELVEQDERQPATVLPMESAIHKMADEIGGVNMLRHRGQNRELAMVLTKLQEARLWAVAYNEQHGATLVMPKAEILRMANADTTDTTVPTGVPNV